MKKILLVSGDENLNRHSFPSVLHDDHTEVLCAMDGKEALRELRRRTFDLCFLDLHLLDLHGMDLMGAIRQLSPETKIVVMTGCDVDDRAMNAIREHAVLLLMKPFDHYRVKALAEDIIEKRIDGYRDYDSLVSRLVGEKRLHERQPVAPPATYAVLVNETGDDHNNYFADTIDASIAGLMIMTNVPLEQGRIIRLKSGNENLRGIVRWVMPEDAGDRYRAGIQFL